MKKCILNFTGHVFFVSLLFLCVFSENSFARSLNLNGNTRLRSELCPDQLKGFENIQVQQLLSGDGKNCYLSIHPRNAWETFIYRDYLLTDNGFLMVFNSYAEHKVTSRSVAAAAADGAREFYFLPSEFTGFQWKVEGDYLVVTGFVGKTLKFSLQTAQLEFISGAQVKIADEVQSDNEGGFEILASDFLYVDAGFILSNSPSYVKSRSSEVRNSSRQTCRLKNTKTYNYIGDSVYLKPLGELTKVVKATCPGFGI